MSGNNKISLITKGILKENPVLVLMLGTCPALATTTSVSTALGMGIATAAVLLCSNILISLLRKIIPDSVRILCNIVIIAGLVSVVQMLMHAFFAPLYEALGVYLPLIVVNCIILGRAEVFASKNKVLDSALDGLGMGLGFICALLVMGTLREVFGAGSFAGFTIPELSEFAVPILVKPAGGFFIFGCMTAVVAKITGSKANAECEACPGAQACGMTEKEA